MDNKTANKRKPFRFNFSISTSESYKFDGATASLL